MRKDTLEENEAGEALFPERILPARIRIDPAMQLLLQPAVVSPAIQTVPPIPYFWKTLKYAGISQDKNDLPLANNRPVP